MVSAPVDSSFGAAADRKMESDRHIMIGSVLYFDTVILKGVSKPEDPGDTGIEGIEQGYVSPHTQLPEKTFRMYPCDAHPAFTKPVGS